MVTLTLVKAARASMRSTILAVVEPGAIDTINC